MTCTGIFLEGETSNPPGGSLIPPVPPEAFVDNFWVGSLQVLADDASYQSWTNILNGALAQGPSNLLLQARALGRSLFQSTAYASLNRTNEEFVTDLYPVFALLLFRRDTLRPVLCLLRLRAAQDDEHERDGFHSFISFPE